MTILALVLLVYSILATLHASFWKSMSNRWRAEAISAHNRCADTIGRPDLRAPEDQGMNRSVSQRMGIIARWKHRQEVNRLCREIEGQA